MLFLCSKPQAAASQTVAFFFKGTLPEIREKNLDRCFRKGGFLNHVRKKFGFLYQHILSYTSIKSAGWAEAFRSTLRERWRRNNSVILALCKPPAPWCQHFCHTARFCCCKKRERTPGVAKSNSGGLNALLLFARRA